MNAIDYIGLDVHKKTISYCIKTPAVIVEEGMLAAERSGLCQLGWKSRATVAWRYGGDDLQRLDLRHTQAVCGTLGDGPSGEDEGDYGGK